MTYENYLNKFIEVYEGLSEDDFNEIAELFPNVKEIDWDNYNPFDQDLVDYIFDSLIDSVDSTTYVEDYSLYDKSVTLDYYVNSLKELEDLEKVFDNNGWCINNYEELKENIEEEERQSKELDAKENLIQKIKNTATLEQLQKFVEEL